MPQDPTKTPRYDTPDYDVSTFDTGRYQGPHPFTTLADHDPSKVLSAAPRLHTLPNGSAIRLEKITGVFFHTVIVQTVDQQIGLQFATDDEARAYAAELIAIVNSQPDPEK